MIGFECLLRRGDFTLEAAFEAPTGITAVFGASGSGKSTILRLIAGLERPESGRIAVDGVTLVDTARGLWVPAHKRRVGFVFQDGVLLPHLSVRGNLDFGRRFSPADTRLPETDAVARLLGIGHLYERRPETLSGGERQRVAIGRALLAAPRLLLLDEPLASLDQARKLEILPYIEDLRDSLDMPIVYVSHSAEEVARLASTVVCLDSGRIAATGSPAQVLGAHHLAGGGARFELSSVLTGTVSRALPEFGLTVLAHPAGEIVLPGRVDGDGPVRVLIRATNVALATEAPQHLSIRTVLKGRVREIESGASPIAVVAVDLQGGQPIYASATRLAIAELGLVPGRDVFALVKAVSIDERGVSGLR